MAPVSDQPHAGGDVRESADADSGVWESSGTGPLAGVRVIDFGQYLAGPLAAVLLADQGADVIRVERPGGPSYSGSANATLLRGRRVVTLALHDPRDVERARKLLASADVAIENFRPGVADRLGIGPEWCAVHAPQLVYCSLPGFGSTDSRRALPGWEGFLMAAAGAYSFELSGALAGVGGGGQAAEFSALPLASVFAGLEAAVGVMAALITRRGDGLGEHIEVPLFDALFEASGVRAMSIDGGGLALTDFGNGFYRCRDGRWVTFVAMWFRHLEWFVQAAGCSAWIDEGLVDFERLWNDPPAIDELRRRLVALFATRDARDWESLAREHGCSLAMLRSADEWLAEPHALASRTLADIEDPYLGPLRVPGRAVEVGSHRERLGARRRGDTPGLAAAIDALVLPAAPTPSVRQSRAPLAGVKVLDMSRVVAAPTSAKLLAQLGADVVKVDTDPDSGRASFKEPALHEHLNRGKQTLIVDAKTASGRAVVRQLVAQADIVVHNFTPGATARLGLEESDLRAIKPDIVYLYLNAFGTDGPWAPHRGYAELANLTTGITERSMGSQAFESGRSPLIDNPRWFFTDYAAGVLGAFAALVGLYSRGDHGVRVETSLVRAASIEQLPYLVGGARDAEGEPRGLAPGWGEGNRLHATKDGYVFVVSDDVSRLNFADLTVDEAVAAVVRIGGAAHRVETLGDLMRPGGIADQRGLRIDDPLPSGGRIVMPGPVIRFERSVMRPGAIPGPFGGDEMAVRARWLASPPTNFE